MEALAKGQVVLFKFPFTDLSERKLRPCVVLSNRMGEDIILCQITSKNTHPDKYTVELEADDTVEGSLQIDSYIRCNMLFTATIQQVEEKVSIVKKKKYNEIVNTITELIS